MEALWEILWGEPTDSLRTLEASTEVSNGQEAAELGVIRGGESYIPELLFFI